MSVDLEEENRNLREQLAAQTELSESKLKAAAEQYRELAEAMEALQRRSADERELYEELMRMQDAAMEELSTPLIPVADDVLVMPLIGSIDATRGERILEAVLTGVTQRGAHAVIIDVSGIPRFHSLLAKLLLRAARAVRLLGAEMIVTGIGAAPARTLIELGLDLTQLRTCGELRVGIAQAMRKRS